MNKYMCIYIYIYIYIHIQCLTCNTSVPQPTPRRRKTTSSDCRSTRSSYLECHVLPRPLDRGFLHGLLDYILHTNVSADDGKPATDDAEKRTREKCEKNLVVSADRSKRQGSQSNDPRKIHRSRKQAASDQWQGKEDRQSAKAL